MIDSLSTVPSAQSPGVTIFPGIAGGDLPLALGRKLGVLQDRAGKCANDNRVFDAIEVVLKEGTP